jgi:hypothetical protein
MASPALALTQASIEAARSKLRSVTDELEASSKLFDEMLTKLVAWLEGLTATNLVWPSIAAVAGDDGQRRRYVEIADGWRAFADDLSAFVSAWGPRLAPTRPDLAERLARAGGERAAELLEFAGVLRCLMDAPDDRVTEAQAASAEALRFEAAKQLVFTLHDDAFARLAR